MNKIVLFDLGNVLLKPFSIPFLYERLNLKVDYETFRSYWSDGEDAQELHKGNISLEEYVKRLSLYAGQKIVYEDFVEIYHQCKRVLFADTLEVVSSVQKKGYRVGILSNLRKIDWELVNSKYDMHMFDFFFLSYEMHLLKPDKAIYKQVIETLGVEPENIYFFDDLEENVLGARELGIQAYCVTGETIKEKLKEYAIFF